MTYGMIFTLLLLASSFTIVMGVITTVGIKLKFMRRLKSIELFSDITLFGCRYINIKIEDSLVDFPCIAEYLGKSFETISWIIAHDDFEYKHVNICRYIDVDWLAELDKEINIASTEVREIVSFNKNLIMAVCRYKYPIRYFFSLRKKEDRMKFEINDLYSKRG